MIELACNYAVMRFMPYRRTAEFVNVGIVVCCPQAGFFDFKCADDHWRRVHGFFPELSRETYRKALRAVKAELAYLKDAFDTGLPADAVQLAAVGEVWKDLVKKREGIIHTALPGIDQSGTPSQTLKVLYDDFVSRHFAGTREYQEAVMRKRLAATLQRWNVKHLFQEARLGNEIFHITMPFVHSSGNRVLEAIKPLDLDRAESTEIYHHADRWLANMRRLKQTGFLPETVIFPLTMPSNPEHERVGREIVQEMERESIIPVRFEEIDRIRDRISKVAA